MGLPAVAFVSRTMRPQTSEASETSTFWGSLREDLTRGDAVPYGDLVILLEDNRVLALCTSRPFTMNYLEILQLVTELLKVSRTLRPGARCAGRQKRLSSPAVAPDDHSRLAPCC